MRTCAFTFCACAALATNSVRAHGPQIQITNTANKIVTRELMQDGPYGASLTAPKSVYVMPVLPFSGVSYSRPNDAIDPILLQPAFPSGPGFAYGYDLADGGPQAFDAGSVFSLGFTAGLKRWNGSAFVDAGAMELKAFRGSDPNISTPAANFAVTSDAGPYDSVSLAAVAAGYGADAAEVHSSLRFALLGDGISPTSSSPDGIYLVGLQVSSTQAGLMPSDPYYFVLNKNVDWGKVSPAVDSLGIAPSLQQWVVPEPGAFLLAAVGAGSLMIVRRRTFRLWELVSRQPHQPSSRARG
jgi:hypothetical protein